MTVNNIRYATFEGEKSKRSPYFLGGRDLDNMTPNINKDKPLARLLVVDDDSDNDEVLKLGLTDYGFLVNAFTNPQEALQKFKTNAELSFGIIWYLDAANNRSSVGKNVKENNHNVKVLLFSGSEKRDVESSKSYPSNSAVDGVAKKLIRIGKLTDTILNLIGETKGRSSLRE